MTSNFNKILEILKIAIQVISAVKVAHEFLNRESTAVVIYKNNYRRRKK